MKDYKYTLFIAALFAFCLILNPPSSLGGVPAPHAAVYADFYRAWLPVTLVGSGANHFSSAGFHPGEGRAFADHPLRLVKHERKYRKHGYRNRNTHSRHQYKQKKFGYHSRHQYKYKHRKYRYGSGHKSRHYYRYRGERYGIDARDRNKNYRKKYRYKYKNAPQVYRHGYRDGYNKALKGSLRDRNHGHGPYKGHSKYKRGYKQGYRDGYKSYKERSRSIKVCYKNRYGKTAYCYLKPRR